MQNFDETPSVPDTTIGVIIVTFRSADVIIACLESLLASRGVQMKIVICDNASPDDTVATIRAWAADYNSRPLAAAPAGAAIEDAVSIAELPAHDRPDLRFECLQDITLLHSPRNLGFAGGVNIGLRTLLPHPQVGLFWILNPDCIVSPQAAAAYVAAAQKKPSFSLMGSRILYLNPSGVIQSDGGRVRRWIGSCYSVNQGELASDAPPPKPDTLDYISGANVVASRTFVEQAGLMREEYFLYFEEVDWALRRGDLPLALCSDAVVCHHGGTAIGSGSLGRRPSAFANYFNYRNLIWFVWRFRPHWLPMAYLYALLKILRLLLQGHWSEGHGAARGLHGLAPPSSVKQQIAPGDRKLAFGRHRMFRSSNYEKVEG